MTIPAPNPPTMPPADLTQLAPPPPIYATDATGALVAAIASHPNPVPASLNAAATLAAYQAAWQALMAVYNAAVANVIAAHTAAGTQPLATDWPAVPAAPALTPVWIVPANATLTAPPAPIAGQWPVLKGGVWAMVEDHRGVAGWDASGDGLFIYRLGPLPAGFSTIKPAPAIAAEAAAATAALLAYANGAQGRVLAKGSFFNVAAVSAAPVMILCDGTSATRADLALLALPTPGVATNHSWVDNNGVSTTLTDAEAARLALLVRGWVANTFATLALVLAQIKAGNLTTSAQIDALPWPTA